MRNRLLSVGPYPRYLQIEILEVGTGVARASMPYRHEFTNPSGSIHGGAIASLADTTMAKAVVSLVGLEVNVASVRLDIRYKAPVTGGKILTEAKVTTQKKRLFTVEVVAKQGNGQVVATATGMFMTIP